MTTPKELPQLHTCPQCGEVFSLSARNTRLHRRRGTTPICSPCRLPEKPVDREALKRYRRYWRRRFTQEELVELGNMLGWR